MTDRQTDPLVAAAEATPWKCAREGRNRQHVVFVLPTAASRPLFSCPGRKISAGVMSGLLSAAQTQQKSSHHHVASKSVSVTFCFIMLPLAFWLCRNSTTLYTVSSPHSPLCPTYTIHTPSIIHTPCCLSLSIILLILLLVMSMLCEYAIKP